MIRRLLVAATLFGVMACAPPSDESDESGESRDEPTEVAAQCFDPHDAAEISYTTEDPRLLDPEYAWSADTLRVGSECVDCHQTPGGAESPAEFYWDVECEPVWTDSATDAALEGVVERLVDPGEDRFYDDMDTRARLADLINSELTRRADRRAE